MRKKPRIGVDVFGASAYYNDMVVDFSKRMHRLSEVKKNMQSVLGRRIIRL